MAKKKKSASKIREEENEELRAQFRAGLGDEGFEPLKGTSGGAKRRASGAAAKEEVATLVRDNFGLLRWRTGVSKFSPVGSGRRAGRAGLVASDVIDQFEFKKLEGSDVAKALTALDKRLTPLAWGTGTGTRNSLRQVKNRKFAPPPSLDQLKGKKVFLFIHGTFSNCDNTIKDLNRTKSGRALLDTLQAKYDFVLTFDHATLSVSPFLNAYDLAAQLRTNLNR